MSSFERHNMHYLAAGGSGLLLVFAFAPFDLYPLAWIALVPFMVNVFLGTPGGAFKSGYLMGMVYFFGTTYWIYNSMHDYGGIALVPSLLIVVGLAAYLSLYTAVFGWLFSLVMNRSRMLPAMFVAPPLWVTLEFVRAYLLTGFPWSSLGYSQWKFPLALQFADITGVYGVSFMLVAVNAALADIFILRRRLREMPLFPVWQTAAGYALLAAALAAAFIYGHWRLSEKRPGTALRAAVIQGNIDQSQKWDARYQAHVYKVHQELTAGAAFQSPDLIVWPEASLPFPFDTEDPRVTALLDYQRRLAIPVLIGAVRQKERATGIYANSAFLIDSGEVTYVYDKIHLVPFGEYVPLERVLFFVNKLSAAIGHYKPGSLYARGRIRQGEFATLVCYEIIFPGLVRKFYRDGGDFIVTITNDAWFGTSGGPYQHFAMAALRAVENRKPVVRAANTGISGFFDSNGRLVSKTDLLERRTLTADIRTDSTRTFYSRYGDIFAYLCVLGLFFLLVFLEEK